MNQFYRIPVILIVVLLFNNLQILAQLKHSELLKGEHGSVSIKPGEKHLYTIRLKDQQFAFINLVQHGVDVIITTYDPDGKKIQEFNSPFRKNGPEPVTILSVKKGSYMLEVRPVDAKQPEGNYELSIIKIEPIALAPDKQIDQLFASWDNPETPGASVAVVKDGKIIFKKGYGSANLEYNIPISPSTVFHIASVSKQFTVFSILLLENEGKLSLDDDIRKYIPEVPDFGKVITLRQLAHHTSGLRDQWTLLAMAGWRLDDVITKEHIMKLVSKQKELNFNPGDNFWYCNTGFTLLAEVVARVSGMSFAEFTSEHIFKPLGMSNTLFYDDHEKIVKNRAYSYYSDDSGYKKSNLNYANVGATSLFTTVEDLSLWAMNFETSVIGNKKIFDEMNERGILNKGDTIPYAMGQFIGKYKGLNFIYHGGSDAGYRTWLGRFPDQRFSVIVLSNNADFNSEGMALKIADIYLKDKRITEKPKESLNPKISESKAVVDDGDLIKSYCGYYEMQPEIFVKTIMTDDKSYAEAPETSKFLPAQVLVTEFEAKGLGASLTSPEKENGKTKNVIILTPGQKILELEAQGFDPDSVNLNEFSGYFYSPELSTTYTFIIRDGKLVATHPRLSDFVLIAVRPDFFQSKQWFFSQIVFIRDANKNIIGCTVSSERIKNLWFEKMK